MSTTEEEKTVAAVSAVPEPYGPQPEPEKPEAEKQLGLDDMTAAEMAMAERQAGQSIGTLGNLAYPQSTLRGALGWQLARRTDPRLKFDDYMKSRSLFDINKELGLAADDDDEDEEGKDDE